jgi:hypothetical protein
VCAFRANYKQTQNDNALGVREPCSRFFPNKTQPPKRSAAALPEAAGEIPVVVSNVYGEAKVTQMIEVR